MATIVITGGNRGIGLELARVYLSAGWHVILGLRRPSASVDHPAGCEILALDVGDSASTSWFADQLDDRAVDVLVNNAGVIGPDRQSSLDMDFDGFLAALNVNTLGPLRVTQALLPNLKRAAASKIAIISSRMGSLAYAKSDHAAYRASKAAVNKVAQCLATDLQPQGIAVASIHPGWVRTDMGGPGADISPRESAEGIKRLLDGLSPESTGRFWNYDGTPMAW